MANNIKSYKLSPQLRAELNFARKKSSPSIDFSQVKIKLPWKGIFMTAFAFAIIFTCYAGVKKGYEFIAHKNEQKKIAQQALYQQRQESLRQEVMNQDLDAYGFVELSKNYLDSRETEKALVAASLAVEKDPEWRDGFVNKALVAMSVNQFETAKQALDQAIMIDPLYGDAHYLQYLALEELKENDQARTELAKAKTFGMTNEVGGQ